MLTITQAQLNQIKTAIENHEPQWAMALLKRKHPDWYARHQTEEIIKFCTETLAFAHQCDLHKKSSFECLLELRVNKQFPWPFSEWQKVLLTRKDFNEETRLSQFLETLSGTDQRILINLDTDLTSLQL
ncbi:MAG: hypothetical protein RLZ92_496 [Pseudomonadota bacterium]